MPPAVHQAARRAEDDVVGIAKTVADNYEDEELRETFVTISLDLCVLAYHYLILSHNASTDGGSAQCH